MSDDTKRGIRICLRVPPDDTEQIFRSRAADETLRLLVDAHESEFTIRELADAIDRNRSTAWRAVEFLAEIDVVRVRETAQRNYVRIDPEFLEKDDPVLGIDQPEFHEPVRAFVEVIADELRDEGAVDELLGVIVFGSVARGTADRKSDVDLFVLVDGDRTVARRVVMEAVAELGERSFDGDRYAFEPYVETTESARRSGEKLREIFVEGVTVYGTSRLDELRKEVVSGER